MADRPLIMSGPMVRALLAGRKTQTRRIIKLPTKGERVNSRLGGWEATTFGGGGCFRIGREGKRIPTREMAAIWNRTTGTCISTRWQVGDRLWVRETCCAEELPDGQDGVRYRADEAFVPISDAPDAASRWVDLAYYRGRGTERIGHPVPPIHMPRWASRLTLDVSDVRVQRLQDISEEDAVAEGVAEDVVGWRVEGCPCGTTPRAAFAMLWNGLHGYGAWEKNPWICAISFSVRHGNIDAPMPARREALNA